MLLYETGGNPQWLKLEVVSTFALTRSVPFPHILEIAVLDLDWHRYYSCLFSDFYYSPPVSCFSFNVSFAANHVIHTRSKITYVERMVL